MDCNQTIQPKLVALGWYVSYQWYPVAIGSPAHGRCWPGVMSVYFWFAGYSQRVRCRRNIIKRQPVKSRAFCWISALSRIIATTVACGFLEANGSGMTVRCVVSCQCRFPGKTSADSCNTAIWFLVIFSRRNRYWWIGYQECSSFWLQFSISLKRLNSCYRAKNKIVYIFIWIQLLKILLKHGSRLLFEKSGRCLRHSSAESNYLFQEVFYFYCDIRLHKVSRMKTKAGAEVRRWNLFSEWAGRSAE
jgi:hypothetical protein